MYSPQLSWCFRNPPSLVIQMSQSSNSERVIVFTNWTTGLQAPNHQAPEANLICEPQPLKPWLKTSSSVRMVKSKMSVKVFVPKDNCAKKQHDLVSFTLPERRTQRMENVALRTGVASKLYLTKKGEKGTNNQAANSSQFPRTLAPSIIKRHEVPLGHRRNNSLNLWWFSSGT